LPDKQAPALSLPGKALSVKRQSFFYFAACFIILPEIDLSTIQPARSWLL
jgi:hypothetical protein